MMHRNKFPFKEMWREKMLSGRKTMTSRNRKLAEIGDTFTSFGVDFVVTDINRHTLKDVAIRFYREEGCETSDEFYQVWKQIYRQFDFRHVQPASMFRRVHEFKPVPEIQR